MTSIDWLAVIGLGAMVLVGATALLAWHGTAERMEAADAEPRRLLTVDPDEWDVARQVAQRMLRRPPTHVEALQQVARLRAWQDVARQARRRPKDAA